MFSLCVSSPGEQEQAARKKNGDGPIPTSSGTTITREQERDARDGPIATSSGPTQREQDAHDGGPHEEEGGTTRKKDPDEEGPERTSKGAEEEERTKGAAEEPVKGGGGVDPCLWSVLGSITGKKPEEEREGQRVEEQSGRAFVKCECDVCRGRAGCTGKVGVCDTSAELPPTELCTDVLQELVQTRIVCGS